MSALPYVQASDRNGVAVIAPVGEFDISAVGMLRSACLDAISPTANRLVLDLAGTTFMDSMALGAIIGVTRRVNEWGGWVRLVAAAPNVRQVLRVTGLDTVFGMYDSVDQAVQHDDTVPVDEAGAHPAAAV